MGLHSAYIVSYHTEYFIRIVLHILDWTVVGQLGVQKWVVGFAKGSLIYLWGLFSVLRFPYYDRPGLQYIHRAPFLSRQSYHL